MPNDKSIANFLDVIDAEAKAEQAKIKNETGKFVERQINSAEKDALAESYDLIRSETSKIRREYGMAVTSKRIELGNQMLVDRNHIKDEVFSKVKEKLLQFKKSDGYKDFLTKSLKNCMAAVGGKNFTVHLSEYDKCFAELLSSVTKNIEIVIDNSIKLGGIKVTGSDGKLTADDTFDARLSAESELFEKNSGLIIRRAEN